MRGWVEVKEQKLRTVGLGRVKNADSWLPAPAQIRGCILALDVTRDLVAPYSQLPP